VKEDRVALLRAAVIERVATTMDGYANLTQSPIEAMVYWALLAESPYGEVQVADLGPDVLPHVSLTTPEGNDITVTPQWTVKCGAKAYRLDFHVEANANAPDAKGGNTVLHMSVALECDGHDFHERTKEQAERDRKRDRDLQSAGFTVLRFTGSEIWRDARVVAREVYAVIDRDLSARFKAAYDNYLAGQATETT
jgi:hypothetical protein